MLEQFFSLQLLDTIYWGNTMKEYLSAAILFVGLLVVFKLIQSVVLIRIKSLAKKTKNDIDDTLVEIVKTLRPSFYFFFALWLSVHALTLHGIISKSFDVILIIWVVAVVIRALKIAIDYIAEKKLSENGDHEPGIVNLIRQMAVGILWVFGGLLILSNLGINITSLIAGLGIGGIAIALALQNILSDLFSSFAIYFDKPFRVGDFIVVGEQSGTVEKIGIKTTRLRSLEGEEVILANKELTSVKINNYRKLRERHVFFKIGVLYDTPQAKLEQIPEIIEEMVEKLEHARFDRTHFIEFGDSALIFEIVYFVDSNDFVVYRDVHHQLLLEMNQRFAKENIGFAYPTQTIYLEK